MSMLSRVLISESYNVGTNEKDRNVYKGKLVNYSALENEYNFAFKINEQVCRMKLSYLNGVCKVIETFPDSKVEIELKLNQKAEYVLSYSSMSLKFETEAKSIKISEDEIELSFVVIDRGEVMLINKITILGE